MNIHLRVKRGAATGLLALLSTACDMRQHPECPPAAIPKTSSPRGQLDIGYSLLYAEVNGTPKMDFVLDFKKKSPDAGEVIDSTMTLYKNLAVTLEGLAKEYPGVHIDVTPMSEIEGDTRKAIGMDMVKDFAPLVGKTGSDFEREVLLMLYNELDEQRHLVAVMIKGETDPGLKTDLNKIEDQLGNQHHKVGALLERRYFTHSASS